MFSSPIGTDTTIILLIMMGILTLVTLLLFILVMLMAKQLRQSRKNCQDSSYIIQRLPTWIKDGITETLKPELDQFRSMFQYYAQIVGDSQTEALEEVVNHFVAELNRKVEESAEQYVMRIAQSTEQFNKSLSAINATVSVTLTDALGSFDRELQATLTDLLSTMKKLRTVTNNVPKVIDHSFAELQRSFDDMEAEMQRTILAFRDMRIKITAQQSILGPVQSGMLRAEVAAQEKPSAAAQQYREVGTADNESGAATGSPEPATPGPNTLRQQQGSINFSNY